MIRYTNRLRTIPNTWHFKCTILVFKVVCSGFDIALLKP
ncbi:DUF3265 domain-containing protein [Vibrio sp. 10N.286.51.C3]|nr:DUF3265 domain-containing protein [Vibrio sp. F12]PTP15136.1 DUF3265 domain-containing protein [Vibrio sp. 10N.286.51.C3]TKE73432.1 DUF3265 domain-containing protein [Vibrio sp. F12]